MVHLLQIKSNQYEMDRMQIEFYSGRQLKAKRKKKLSCKTKIASY